VFHSSEIRKTKFCSLQGKIRKTANQISTTIISQPVGEYQYMSTPSGKPLNPIDPSANSVSHERAIRERHPIESDNESLRSPYVPTGSHERAVAQRYPVENDHDPLQSPYAPKKARVQPAVEQDFAISEDVAPLAPLRASEGLREHPERRAVDVHEPYLFSHDAAGDPRAPGRPFLDEQDGRNLSTKKAFEGVAEKHTVDLHAVASLQPVHAANSPHQEQPAAVRCDEIIRDLGRLAASVRWVQREEAAARLPRTARLPSVPGLAPVDARGRGYSDGMFDNRFWSPRPLEPERLVPPPAMRSRRDNLRGPLIILIVSILAASIAYYFLVGGGGPISEPPPGPQMASFDSKFITSLPRPSSQEDSRTIIVRDNDPGTPAEGEIPSEHPQSSPTAKSFAGETVAMLQPGTPGAQPPPLSTAVRVLDPEEIELLMKKGEQFIAAGDVVTARIAFQRAAEAGDANAAIALGATYDPTVLPKLGVVGISADVAKARSWYQKAEKLGSPEGRGRLDVLADR
jgi:hypothetical protein